MPQFTTISPTHVAGKKEYAWQNFLKGRYVAIGWLEDTDLTGKSIEDIENLLEDVYPDKPDSVSHATHVFQRFLNLEKGDYVAIPNVNFGIFGVGIVTSGYKFKENIHDTGSGEKKHFYSHCREVEWLVKNYHESSEILLEGEKAWQPFGTVGKLQNHVPAYIARLVGLPPETISPRLAKHAKIRPEFLTALIERIEVFRKDEEHQERDHESLVEAFFVSIGYARQADLKFRRGHIDLIIGADGLRLAVVEVKRTWDLDYDGDNAIKARKQAYQYAHETGMRYVLVTNGDDYMLFDRLKGLSWETNLLAEWKLTALRDEDLTMIDRLRPERLSKPSLTELFQYLSEAFGK
jgi:predicted Mrr-cat superfamily restriction endonuclease